MRKNNLQNRYILLSIVFAFLCSLLLSACENITIEPDGSATESSFSGPNAEAKRSLAALPDTDRYQDQSFVIAVADNKPYTFSDESEESILRHAVEVRNAMIAEKYGADILVKYARASDLTAGMLIAESAGLPYADLISFPADTLSALVANNKLLNLNDAPGFRADAAFIDTVNVNRLAVNGKLFFLYTQATMYIEDTWAVFYNRKLIEGAGLADPETLVASGSWTWDRLVKYAEIVAAETLQKGSPDLAIDKFGIASEAVNTALPSVLWGSSGLSIFDKTSSLQIAEDLSAQKEALGKLKGVYQHPTMYPVEGAEVLDAFADERIGFLIAKLSAASILYDSKQNWGLLPLPKVDGANSYHSVISPEAQALAIPLNNTDNEKSVTLLNAVCASSQSTIRSALTDKYASLFFQSNQATVELGRIMDTAYADLGLLYGSGIPQFAAVTTDAVNGTLKLNEVFDRTVQSKKAAFDPVVERIFS